MPSEACIGRVGGLAVALGLGVAVISVWGSGLARADDSPGPSESPVPNSEAGPDAATANESDSSVPKVATPQSAALRFVVGTGGSRRHAWTPATKSPRVTPRSGDDEDSPGTPGRQKGSDRAAAKATTTRTPAPLSAGAEVKPDATPTVGAFTKRATKSLSRSSDVIDVATERPRGVEPQRTVSPQSPAAATPSETEPGPRVVGVASRLMSGVAEAILTPFAATGTPGAPADPASMWALLAFARREFESAVRSPSLAGGTLQDRQKTSETMVESVQPEQRTLVLTAFPAEADAILARTTLDPNPTVVVDGHHYYLGTLGGKKVIVAMTGIGMENATDTTESALDHFTPESGISIDAVVFAGVAGGSGRTEIGDVAVPARWTSDDGTTWHAVDPDMLAAADAVTVDLESIDSIGDPACRVCGPLARLRLIDLGREPQLFVGGDGSTDDNNNGAAFPAIPLGGAIFGPQPLAAPDFSPLFTGNFFRALVPFLARGVVSNITGFLADENPSVDAVDQETAAAQQVADAHGVPFLGIRGMSDGPGDPLNLPGYPFTFVVYKQIAADNAAIVTESFLQNWDGPEG